MCSARREKSDLCNRIYICNWVLLGMLSTPFTIEYGVNDVDDVSSNVGEVAGVWNKLYICSFNIASLESILCEIGLDDEVVLLQQGIGFNNDCEEEDDDETARDE